MSFGDHLDELRRRVLWALALPLPAAIIMFFFSDTLIQWLLLPLFGVLRAQGLPERTLILSPPEGIFLKLKLSFIAAIIISAPWIVWQLWLFIKPGLYQHERRFVNLLIPGSVVLTIMAVAITYWGMLPLMLRVLVAVGASLGSGSAPAIDPRAAEVIQNNPSMQLLERHPPLPRPGDTWILWPQMKRYVAVAAVDGQIEILDAPQSSGSVVQDFRLSEYVSFALLFMLGVAIAFQMPLVVLLLGWVGLASAPWLRAHRKYALFICGVIAAMVTPSADLISMLVLMVPLYLLYELGIVLLVLAPAGAVAEGRAFRRWRSPDSDKDREPPDQPHPPAQPELTVARNRRPSKASAEDDDGGEVGAP